LLTSLADGALLADKTGATPPTVIALHGWARTGADFAPIVDGLDAVSIHMPGFGVTPPPASVWGSPEYADDVAAAIAGFGPVVIVGHSFGGRVAVHLAERHPELVRGLLLTGAPLKRLVAAPTPSLGYRISRRLARAGLVSKKSMDARREKNGSDDYRNAQGIMRDIFVKVVNETYDDQLRAISAPTRMVWGSLDTSAPVDAGEAASKLIAGASFTVVPGASHLLEGATRDEVRRQLLELLAEVRA
jgi:pimeloyl-ACP methyl ester carboxylesterase